MYMYKHLHSQVGEDYIQVLITIVEQLVYHLGEEILCEAVHMNHLCLPVILQQQNRISIVAMNFLATYTHTHNVYCIQLTESLTMLKLPNHWLRKLS